jgi:PhzF family phenazine biosynthesis protein
VSLPFHIVSAFSATPFAGNPAAVLRLPAAAWPQDAWLQGVAAQFNLSETAFLRPGAGGAWDLRWFTPLAEVDLCGHATLASAAALWDAAVLGPDEAARFDTRSGRLSCVRGERGIGMDFPAVPAQLIAEPAGLMAALGASPLQVLQAGDDWLVELSDATAVAELEPDLEPLKAFPARCVVVTAEGKDCDFVSRVFGPRVGIPEDPVTGSTHCALGPWWGARLGKQALQARQLSRRGGELSVELQGDRVLLWGRACVTGRGHWEAD